MLESITVNYNSRDFFGFLKFNSDSCFSPTKAEVDKALNAVRKGDVYVHFFYADGQHDCVNMDALDEFDGTWTLTHWTAPNSKDEPVRISPREARKRIRAAIAK